MVRSMNTCSRRMSQRPAQIPVVVAVNKMDKPDATPDRVKQQLSEHGLQ